MRKIALIVLLLLTACSGSPGKTTLIVYSPHGKELLTEFEKRFEAAHPDIDVRWLDMGSQDALDRVRSEKANPQADIWWGAPSTMFSQAEKEGLLDPYRPSWADKVDQDAHSRTDAWYGTFQTPEVIAYNSKALKREEVPREVLEKEKEMIIKALEKHKGKRKYAAEELGISERTLYRKINEYHIEE